MSLILVSKTFLKNIFKVLVIFPGRVVVFFKLHFVNNISTSSLSLYCNYIQIMKLKQFEIVKEKCCFTG